LSGLISVAVFALPIAAGIGAAYGVGRLLPQAGNLWELVGWWVVVLGSSTVAVAVVERLTRRALPLAVLLRMTLLFPDQAPKRLKVARKAASTRDLARRVEEARSHGIDDEPSQAAERILTLAGALNAHDRLTRGHAERVRVLTDMIAA
jgi:hypothetical protein